MKKNVERNLTMVMDLYELTMANGYFNHCDVNTLVAFDVFYRKNPDNGGFSIFAGLEQIVDYINELHFTTEDINYLKSLNKFSDKFLDYLKSFKFHGTITSIPEGTIMYPNTPIMTIIAPIIEAQLIETNILLEINHQSLIATKARRVVKAANGNAVVDLANVADFGARRAHNVDAAVYGARAAYIGGVSSTATVMAGQMFNIPVTGTMAHSWIMYFPDEYTAFKNYAISYPDDSVFLVDTYDVLKSGIPNAIKVAKEILIPQGKRLKGVRLDSGDLAYLSKEARKMLDEADLNDCKIIASNSLDENIITSLIQQGAKIDSYGVGERMITAKSEPVFGAVYKLVAVKEKDEWVSKIKISENIEKVTNPGLKKLYRVISVDSGQNIADLLTLADENLTNEDSYECIDPSKPWKKVELKYCIFKPLHEEIFVDGKCIYKKKSLKEIRNFVKYELEHYVWEEEQRFENPHIHYVNMSKKLYELKLNLLNNK